METQEEIIVRHLENQSYSTKLVLEVCATECLGLDMRRVEDEVFHRREMWSFYNRTGNRDFCVKIVNLQKELHKLN